MKGGKDMKKIYIMIEKKDKYILNDSNGNEMMDIKKNTLNIDGKKIYELFFKDFNKDDSIIIEKDKSIDDSKDKLSLVVYENYKEIIEKISAGINEINKE